MHYFTKQRDPSLITELIPGHLYEDDRGRGLIFVGNIILYEIYESSVKFPVRNGYSFFYWDDLKKALDSGILSQDFSFYNFETLDKLIKPFIRLIKFSKHPFRIVKDYGIYFPEDFFEDKLIKEKYFGFTNRFCDDCFEIRQK